VAYRSANNNQRWRWRNDYNHFRTNGIQGVDRQRLQRREDALSTRARSATASSADSASSNASFSCRQQHVTMQCEMEAVRRYRMHGKAGDGRQQQCTRRHNTNRPRHFAKKLHPHMCTTSTQILRHMHVRNVTAYACTNTCPLHRIQKYTHIPPLPASASQGPWPGPPP